MAELDEDAEQLLLLHVTETSNGRLKHGVHFDDKAEVERYICFKGIPSTLVLRGYFMSNFTALQMIRKGEDGVYNLAYPVSEKAKFPLIDIQSDIVRLSSCVSSGVTANPR